MKLAGHSIPRHPAPKSARVFTKARFLCFHLTQTGAPPGADARAPPDPVLPYPAARPEASMNTKTIESVLQENRVFPPNPALAKNAAIPSMDAYRKLCAEADRDFEGFWGKLAREHVLWHKPFARVLDASKAPFFKWFDDGELNASYNS